MIMIEFLLPFKTTGSKSLTYIEQTPKVSDIIFVKLKILIKKVN